MQGSKTTCFDARVSHMNERRMISTTTVRYLKALVLACLAVGNPGLYFVGPGNPTGY